jgi:hypothetical protein
VLSTKLPAHLKFKPMSLVTKNRNKPLAIIKVVLKIDNQGSQKVKQSLTNHPFIAIFFIRIVSSLRFLFFWKQLGLTNQPTNSSLILIIFSKNWNGQFFDFVIV